MRVAIQPEHLLRRRVLRRANRGLSQRSDAPAGLNRDPPEGDDPLFAERGPKSLFAMIGHMGQYVLVAPDRKLTTAPGSTHAKLMWALDDELHTRGIEIPFPQRDLHVKSGALEVRLTKD